MCKRCNIQCTPAFSRVTWPVMVLLTTLIIITGCRTKQQEFPVNDQTVKNQIAATDYQAPSSAPEIVFEEPDLPQPAEVKLAGQTTAPDCDSPSPEKPRPRIAIIIDDMGYHQKIGDRLLDMDIALTFSFLPRAPFTLEMEEKAYQKGRDILVHLPMEAQDPSWNLGPGALYLSDTPEKIAATTLENINAVPHAIGANNHMGSRFTEERQAMRVVLAELKKQGLFFIDSYTTAKSTGMEEAA
ncbi:MAG: hypothetical protein GQ559_05290, partial [Desulfobulbaceae bacterium]|nr:hypothetical protein [Desulfobulbaceae bacterium]